MIHLHLIDNLLEPGKRRSLEVPWRPELRFADLVPGELATLAGLIVARNGERVLDLSDLACDCDHVTVSVVPGALSAVQLAVILLATTALEAMLAPKIPVVERGDERSPTYGFSGIAPTRAEGTPIQRYYGRLRVGGQVITEFVESRGPLGSWYNALIALGNGPIQSICGVTADTDPDQPLRSDAPEELRVPATLFINDTPATDYDGVELHVRLGTAEQLPIPGFNLDEQTVDISTPLTGAPSSGSTYEWMLPFWPLSPGGSSGADLADEDATWGLYGVAQSILDRDVDHFTVVVQYPQGLYSLSSSGSPYEFATSIAVRYVELDGGGAPITSGGPHGDGYVRLRPTPLYRAEVQGAFSLDFRFPFYDPQTYTLPTRSLILSFDIGSAPFQEAWLDRAGGLTYPASWSAGSTTAAVSAEWMAVVRPNGNRTGAVSGVTDADLTVPAPLLDLLDTTTNRGFRVVYRYQQFQVAAGQFRSRIVPVVQVGNGTVVKDYFDRNPDGQTASVTASEFGDARWRGVVHSEAPGSVDGPLSDWTHGAFTYQPNAVGALDRLRIYCDGELIVEILATLDMTLPAAATAFNIGRRTGSTFANLEYFKGDVDELVLYDRELTSDEVRRSSNTGFGTFHSGTANIVAGYHFEESPPVVGASGSVADFGLLGNHLTTRLGAAIGTPHAENVRVGSLRGIMDKLVATNTIKRSRYRVEVMRGLKDVTTTARVDDSVWSLLQTHVDEQFSFPGIALLAVRVRAQDQLNGSRPSITEVIEGALCPVWDGASASAPSFVARYTRNPAWVLADLHLDRRSGLGQFFTGKNLDLASFQELADYAAALIYDLRGDPRELDDTLGPVSNLVYTSGGLGQVEVQFLPGIDPPGHLIAGSYVGFDGLNTPATNPGRVFQDCNLATIDGFLVTSALTSAQNGGAGGVIRLQYQKDATTAYADPPWGGSGDLNLALNGTSPSLQGALQGREQRFCFDGAVDEVRSSSDVIQNVVNTCRTILVREGTRVRLRVLKPEPVVDLIGQTQEIRDTFEVSYASPGSRPNAYDASIIDESLLWDRTVVPLEDAGVADGTDLGAIRRASVTYEGVTRRSQALRMMRFLLNSNTLSLRSGRFTCSIDALALEVGDVIQVAHDCVPRGTSGRVESSSAADTLVLDRTFVLESGKTYDLSVRTLGGGYQTSTVTSVAGTYVAAVDELTVSPAFDVQPEKGQAALLCEQGLELRARVTRISLTRDLQREVEWVEYAAAAFDVDELGQTPDLPQALVLAAPDLSGSTQVAPANVLELAAHERLIRGAGSAPIPHVALSWRHDPSTEAVVSQTEVHLAVDTGPWRLLGAVQGLARSALLRLPDATPGTRYRLAAVAVGARGAKRAPSRSAVVRLTVYGASVAPDGPSDFSATLSGDSAVYSLEPSSARAGLPHELRAGGWILGQPLESVGTGRRSVSSPSWLLGAQNLAGDEAPPLHARARATDGAVSAEASLSWQPVPFGYSDLSDVHVETLEEQAWEDYADGWHDDTFPTPLFNTALLGLQRAADGYLEFSGSDLAAQFYTTDVLLAAALVTGTVYRRELVHLSAFAVAEQVHPLVWDDATFTWEEAQQLSFEGPASDVGDAEDLGQCTLRISVRLLDLDGNWSEWQDYRPGTAACVTAQFRLDVTRPDPSFQVQIHRFSTKLVRVPQHKHLRSPLQALLEGGATRRG